ncbi:type II 3-dehydroquinate dehydratase [Hydrogenophaga sp. OTU3427]|uniref:type II 3-dehydroquinate dehydratase n=1 Tax=Hydrogenophaga sp. OTU3427 TaxID=3043856 RepID=UPI00313EAEE5
MDILLLQGANMKRLGRRQPVEKYGRFTAAELDACIQTHAKKLDLNVEIFYTDFEGEAIQKIDEAAGRGVRGLIMNPAGFVYSGFALRDCLRDQTFPYIEIHLSNGGVQNKTISATAEPSVGTICGFGPGSYLLALNQMKRLLASSTKH